MLISILIFIITLLVLVVIHELGHFIMAKRFGIKVEEFGFGIPPKIFGKKIGETLYSLNALPLGGFVRLLGEDEIDKKLLNNPRSFASQNVWKRILVVVAGVVMNLILSWIIFYTVIFYQNFKIVYPTLEPAVFVGYLEKDFPAQKAGINIGDKVLEVDGREVKQFEDARNFIREKKGEAVTLTLSDIDGKNQRVLTMMPKKTEGGEALIGVGFSPLATKQYTRGVEKIFSGITYSYNLTRLTFVGLKRTISDLIFGNFKSASQSVAGPVGLANMSNNILSSGREAWPFYLWFVGVISLTLSIFNILPIPALDGGRLLFLVIEAVSKKKVREDIERLVHQIGFVLLLALALLVTYSDIRKMLP
ncbi:site-2 protease family protein [Candidatus Daviesbacteria bacterium]|nr:site-2 protease family protein [Candidatus Daviesbacteria bacterium]